MTENLVGVTKLSLHDVYGYFFVAWVCEPSCLGGGPKSERVKCTPVEYTYFPFLLLLWISDLLQVTVLLVWN